MKTTGKIIAAALLCAFLGSCMRAASHSPAVTAHASSFGMAPVMDNQGRMMGAHPSGATSRGGNIFND